LLPLPKSQDFGCCIPGCPNCITLPFAGNTTTAAKGNGKAFSSAGDDTINGGTGFDAVFSGDGDALVFGGGGPDTRIRFANIQSIDASGYAGPATFLGADGVETIITN
jgi:hypothetical protein